MADIFSKEKRSKIMSSISGRNTKPEIILRKALFSKGYRYRINYKKLPGKPDIVLSKYRTVIFVNGCFWHAHPNCIDAHLPKTNTKFWGDKIGSNVERDKKSIQQLRELGWNVIVIWECEIKKKNMDSLINKIINILPQEQSKGNVIIKLYDEVDGEITKVAEETVAYRTIPKNSNK
jgi:DNA mismatch endonuclease (patch repair protein)